MKEEFLQPFYLNKYLIENHIHLKNVSDRIYQCMNVVRLPIVYDYNFIENVSES